jgi:flavin reductase (DIM6/NTAB) family NADH-FMN oxidoreductase RutF
MMPDGSNQMGGSFVPSAENARAFRIALGSFATGVTLVTTQGPDGPMGFVANSFSSLSMDPPLVLWSPARSSRRFPLFASARYFSIHVLTATQQDLIQNFATGGTGFADLPHQTTVQGVPILPDALARFDCEQHATHEGGDHLIVVGRVLLATNRTAEPLVFAQGKYGGFTERG